MSIAKFYPEGTIISSGISKHMGAGGWRLGYFVFPRELQWLLKPMVCVATETFSGISIVYIHPKAVSAPVQYATISAFQSDPALDKYLANSRKILKTLSKKVVDILLDAGIKIHYPEGGFYVFPSFAPFHKELARQGLHTDIDLAKRILSDTGVAMLPGR